MKKENDLKNKSIHLVKDLSAKNCAIQVQIDPILLEQSIMVILDNSMKALHIGGTLRVEMQSEPSVKPHSKGNVSIVISDTGEGMSKQVLKKLFTPFFTTRERGLGLGLALARNFISLHHGDIFIESEKNMGTTVTITLPKS